MPARPEQPLSDEATPAPSKPRARKGWSTTTKVISATIAVVGAVTGVVSVVQVMTRDTSGFHTLSLTATATTSGTTEFALPLSEIDAGFPASATPCGSEQLDWLEARAEPLERRLRIEMRNNASEGAMLALVGFRAEIESAKSDSTTHVLVLCPTDTPVTAVRAAALTVDTAEATARFRALRNTQQSQAIPDIPVSWNLAPGETGVLDIELSAERSTAGSLVVTALSGRDQSALPIVGSDFELPGLWRHGDSYLIVGAGGFECVREVPGGEAVGCDDEDTADLARVRDVAYSAS